MIAHRDGFARVARRPDLDADLIDEIIATGDQWLPHAPIPAIRRSTEVCRSQPNCGWRDIGTPTSALP